MSNSHQSLKAEGLYKKYGTRMVVKDVDVSMIDELFLVTQPAHLQQQIGEKLTGEERDVHRADLLRKKLSGISGVHLSQ